MCCGRVERFSHILKAKRCKADCMIMSDCIHKPWRTVGMCCRFRNKKWIAKLCILLADIGKIMYINIRCIDINGRGCIIPHLHHFGNRSTGWIYSRLCPLCQPAVDRHRKIILCFSGCCDMLLSDSSAITFGTQKKHPSPDRAFPRGRGSTPPCAPARIGLPCHSEALGFGPQALLFFSPSKQKR